MKSNQTINESLWAGRLYAHHEPFDDVPTPKTVTDLHPVLIRRTHILYSDDAYEFLARRKGKSIYNSNRHRRLRRR